MSIGVTSALPIIEPPPLAGGFGGVGTGAGAGVMAGLGASLTAGRSGASAGVGDRTERNFFLKKLNIE